MKYSELAEQISVGRAALEKDKDIDRCVQKLEDLSTALEKTYEEIDERITEVSKQTGESLEALTQLISQAIEENETKIKRLSQENGSLFARVEDFESALLKLKRERIL